MVPKIAVERARATTETKQKKGGRRMDRTDEELKAASINLDSESEDVASDFDGSNQDIDAENQDLEAESESELEEAEKELMEAIKLSSSSKDKSVEDLISEKFVLLSDVLPPLPEKGSFKIDEIKVSTESSQRCGLVF